MPLFVAYFDASGSPRDPNTQVLSVAGWVSTESKWRKFESDWAAALKDAGVSALHMKKCAHFRGEFAKWKSDPTQRDKFLSALRAAVLRAADALVHVFRGGPAPRLDVAPEFEKLVLAGLACGRRHASVKAAAHHSTPCARRTRRPSSAMTPHSADRVQCNVTGECPFDVMIIVPCSLVM